MSSAWVNTRLAAFTPVGCLPLLLGVVSGLASMLGVAAFYVLGVGCGAGVEVDSVSEPRITGPDALLSIAFHLGVSCSLVHELLKAKFFLF